MQWIHHCANANIALSLAPIYLLRSSVLLLFCCYTSINWSYCHKCASFTVNALLSLNTSYNSASKVSSSMGFQKLLFSSDYSYNPFCGRMMQQYFMKKFLCLMQMKTNTDCVSKEWQSQSRGTSHVASLVLFSRCDSLWETGLVTWCWSFPCVHLLVLDNSASLYLGLLRLSDVLHQSSLVSQMEALCASLINLGAH